MYGMILAAGFGTRLKSLSDERPKPMLPVCDQPLVRWAAGLLVAHGAGELVVNLHHLGEQIATELEEGEELGVAVRYAPEPEILGTGGGIRNMARLMPRQTCVAINGKIVVDVDLEAAIAHHRQTGALATVVLKEVEDAERWGALGCDGDGRLTRLLQRRRGDVDRVGMFTGIHVLEPEFIEAIPADGACCVIRTAYTELFERGAPMAAWFHPGYFHEHSTPERYLEGNFNLLDGRATPAGRPPRLTGVSSDAVVDPSATVLDPVLIGAGVQVGAGARVGPHVVLGAGCTVAPGAELERCVAWPGARIAGRWRDAVLTPRQQLEAHR